MPRLPGQAAGDSSGCRHGRAIRYHAFARARSSRNPRGRRMRRENLKPRLEAARDAAERARRRVQAALDELEAARTDAATAQLAAEEARDAAESAQAWAEGIAQEAELAQRNLQDFLAMAA